MNFEEHAAKSLILAPAGIPVPRGILCISAAEAAMAAAKIGPCVVKAQVPTGKRGKAGGIKLARYAGRSQKVGREQILGMRIGDYTVERLLVEEQAEISREFYAAVLHDAAARKPLILFSTEGGMDIEEIAAAKPAAIRRLLVDIDSKPSAADTRRHAQGPRPRRGGRADRAHSRPALRRLSRARRRASGDQSAGAAGRWPRGRARLQIRARRCGDLPPAGDRQRRRGRRHDRAGSSAAPRPASS